MVTDGSDEWAIYGGTGVFAMATGVMKRRNLAGGSNDGNSDELALEVFCPVFGASQQPISKQQVLYVRERERERERKKNSRIYILGNILISCCNAGLHLLRHQDRTMGRTGRVGTGHHGRAATTASAQHYRPRWRCRRLHRVHLHRRRWAEAHCWAVGWTWRQCSNGEQHAVVLHRIIHQPLHEA
jgi:hypothetical protein